MPKPNRKIFEAFELLQSLAVERMNVKLDDYPSQLQSVSLELDALIHKDMADFRQVMRDAPPLSVLETREKIGKKEIGCQSFLTTIQ